MAPDNITIILRGNRSTQLTPMIFTKPESKKARHVEKVSRNRQSLWIRDNKRKR